MKNIYKIVDSLPSGDFARNICYTLAQLYRIPVALVGRIFIDSYYLGHKFQITLNHTSVFCFPLSQIYIWFPLLELFGKLPHCPNIFAQP